MVEQSVLQAAPHRECAALGVWLSVTHVEVAEWHPLATRLVQRYAHSDIGVTRMGQEEPGQLEIRKPGHQGFSDDGLVEARFRIVSMRSDPGFPGLLQTEFRHGSFHV